MAPNDHPAEKEYCAKNPNTFDELIHILQREEASDNGRKALQILRKHLKVLKVTDYNIRAKNAATLLKTSDEVISNCLLIAMVLKDLLFEFKQITSVISQKYKLVTFSGFKVALQTFKELEMIEKNNSENIIMGHRIQRPRLKPETNNVYLLCMW